VEFSNKRGTNMSEEKIYDVTSLLQGMQE
jgi:hypothetical protein